MLAVRSTEDVRMRALPQKLWIAVAGLLGLQVVGILRLGQSPAGSLLANSIQTAASALAGVSSLLARKRATGIARWFWLLVGLGFFVWSGANVGWSFYEDILRVPVPHPSPVPYLYDFLAGFIGMALFLNEDRDSEKLSWSTLLNFVQIAIVLSFLYFDFYYIPALSIGAHAAALRDSTIDTAGNFGLAFIALIQMRRVRLPALRVLYSGAATFLVCYGICVFAAEYGQLYRGNSTGGWYDVCWTVPFLLATLMAGKWEQPTEQAVPDPDPETTLTVVTTRYLMIALAPMVIAVLAARLPDRWELLGAYTVGISGACYAARLILGELARARTARQLREVLAVLRVSEDDYRQFIAQSSEGIFRSVCEPPLDLALPLEQQIELCLRNGYVTECNEALARMFGVPSANAMVGKRLGELMPQEVPACREFVEQMVRSGFQIEDYEVRLPDPAGGLRVFQMSLNGLIESGQLTQGWGVQRDVSERVKLESQLRQSQKMEAVGRLAGGVAHDFNNILGVIIGYSELSQQDLETARPVGKHIEQIKKAAERAAALTKQLLAFSRRQVVFPQPIDLNGVIRNAQQMLARIVGEDVSIKFVPTEPMGLVNADSGQLEQVLMNLIINARDAMPKGGQVMVTTCETEMADNSTPSHPTLTPGKYVALVVSDTGVGMAAETKARIFEPFFTTKEFGKGTGLGLATVYGIVKQAGGHISVHSEFGKGTTFKVYLPRIERPGAFVPADANAAKSLGGGETILLTEDDAALREMAATLLRSGGYQVLEAAEAQEALAITRGYSGKIDLLLTDLVMPGMDGGELSEELLKLRPGLKVLYMSGYGGDRLPNQEKLQSGNRLLEKPFTKNGLFKKVRAAIEETTPKLQSPPVSQPFR